MTDADDAEAPAEVLAQAEAAAKRRRGAQKAPVKRPVTLRLDADLVEHLRAGGRGWQTRVNALLRRAVGV